MKVADSARSHDPGTLQCPVCGLDARYAGIARYYTQERHFYTPMFHCGSCGLYLRSVSANDLEGHCYAASYVQPANEPRFFGARRDFFEYLLRIIERELANSVPNPTLVDFGCSYGHLLEVAYNRGFIATGVELNSRLRQHCCGKGLSVVAQISDIPGGTTNVVTMVDSLYYVSKPLEVLRQIRELLTPGGILVLRVTNRNWVATLRRRLLKNSDLSVLGDGMVSYSQKGIRKALANAGFDVLRELPDRGTGKKLGIQRKGLYALLDLVTLLFGGRLIFTPGIVVVARRNFLRKGIQ